MKKIRVLSGVFLFAAAIMLASVAYDRLSRQDTAQALVGEAAQPDERVAALDFTARDAAGNAVRLSDLYGKPIVINFWASWCPPCKTEMPGFEAVYQEMGADIVFMMVNLTDGQRETTEIAKQYLADAGFTFPVYFDTDLEAAQAYAVRSIPTTLFIDREGYVVTGAQGAISEETLRKGIGMIA